jgi:hypothetical protein
MLTTIFPISTDLVSPWRAVAEAARALGSLLLSNGHDIDGDGVELEEKMLGWIGFFISHLV